MSGTKACILIVDRVAAMRRLMRTLMLNEGFNAIDAADFESAIQASKTRYPDAVILDTDLPDSAGLALITAIRDYSDVPILVLTECNSEDDMVMALEAGADDYLIKPFGSRELLARLKAQLRRRASCMVAGSQVLEFGDVRIDLYRRMVSRQNQPVHFTPIEYNLLTHLARNPHRVLPHSELLNVVWGHMHEEDTQYLRVYVRNLRKKIEVDPSQPRHLLTETNVGYRFVP